MKTCYLQHSPPTPDLAGAAWCRVLDGDALTLADLDPLTGSIASKASGGFPYDIILLDVTSMALDTPQSVRRLLGSNPSTKLVLLVGHSLPNEPDTLERWKMALSMGDLVLAPQYAICLDILRKTGTIAHEILLPQPLVEDEQFATEPQRVVTVIASADYSHRDLIREIGISAYFWTRLRYKLNFVSAAAPALYLSSLVRRSALVYLPEPIEDGGALAAACASSGAILIANRGYDPAKLLFPFTTFGVGDKKRRRSVLFLWLYGFRKMTAFLRENTKHAVKQLRDENRRVQFFCRIQYQFPEHRYLPRPDTPPALLDQIYHHSGPREVCCDEDECILVCLVRNGQEYIPSFLKHYRSLGVRHFIFIDNGSDDTTIALLEEQDGVTIYKTSLPHKYYENEIRRLVIEKHCRHHFCLNVDIDELFDYPLSEKLSLSDLLTYLRQQGMTAMAGYMLDMYNKENILDSRKELDLKSSYPYYNITKIKKFAYHADMIAAHCDQNTLTADHVKTYYGGIRKMIFGGGYLLTKHPLIFLDGTLEPVTHPHYSNKAKVADVTCVLYHYKFTPSFKDRTGETQASRRYMKFAQDQYDRYHANIRRKDILLIDVPGTQRLASTNQLVEQGFIATSPQFEEYVRQTTQEKGSARHN